MPTLTIFLLPPPPPHQMCKHEHALYKKIIIMYFNIECGGIVLVQAHCYVGSIMFLVTTFVQ